MKRSTAKTCPRPAVRRRRSASPRCAASSPRVAAPTSSSPTSMATSSRSTTASWTLSSSRNWSPRRGRPVMRATSTGPSPAIATRCGYGVGPPSTASTASLSSAAASRLDELRMTTNEERLKLELDVGRHHELVSELTELVDDYPLRERLRGHLMLALYRCGRTAEALQMYRQARRTMIDELGIEPGERLQQLQHAILRSDPDLDLATEPPWVQPANRRAPNLLPTDIADFTGRTEEIDQIRTRHYRPGRGGERPGRADRGGRGQGRRGQDQHSHPRLARPGPRFPRRAAVRRPARRGLASGRPHAGAPSVPARARRARTANPPEAWTSRRRCTATCSPTGRS